MVGKKVDVNVPGGRLNIEILDGDVLQLTGPAEMIYEGTY
jgi:diaminopimelate epimerase